MTLFIFWPDTALHVTRLGADRMDFPYVKLIMIHRAKLKRGGLMTHRGEPLWLDEPHTAIGERPPPLKIHLANSTLLTK